MIERKIALLLDLDGTLLDYAPRPDEARAAPGLIALLEDLSRSLDGALAIVSGRPIFAIDAIVEPLRLPAVGVHGVEIRPAAAHGVVRTHIASAPSVLGAAAVAAIARCPEAIVEDKGEALAVHARFSHSARREMRSALADTLRPFGPGWMILDGRDVIEVKPRSVDKGTGTRVLLGTAPFAGRHPIYVGDDLTDLDAFAAVRERGGTAISVGERVRAEGDLHLGSAGDVRRWLAELLVALASGSSRIRLPRCAPPIS